MLDIQRGEHSKGGRIGFKGAVGRVGEMHLQLSVYTT